jgi:hypothetical protein
MKERVLDTGYRSRKYKLHECSFLTRPLLLHLAPFESVIFRNVAGEANQVLVLSYFTPSFLSQSFSDLCFPNASIGHHRLVLSTLSPERWVVPEMWKCGFVQKLDRSV